MDSKTLYNIKVFEKLGSPLMNSVLRAAYQKEGAVSADDANQIASLISTAVKMSQSLTGNFEPEDADDADALRLALACLTSPIIAEHYAKTGKVLSDDEITSFKNIFDHVLGFTDGFTKAKEAANRRLRLANPDPLAVSERLLFDDDQMALQGMQAMLPVIIRVAEYSFGRDPKELLSEIFTKLKSRAKLLAKSLYGKNMDETDQSLAELGILRALTHIYASCHSAERRRIEEMDETKREKLLKNGVVPLDTLWQMFEMRSGLMVALTQSMTAQGSKSATDGNAPKHGASEEKSPMGFFAKPKTDDGAAHEDQSDDDGEEGKAGSGDSRSVKSSSDEKASQQKMGNPMSFFSKKTG